jgi:hypothetical protein
VHGHSLTPALSQGERGPFGIAGKHSACRMPCQDCRFVGRITRQRYPQMALVADNLFQVIRPANLDASSCVEVSYSSGVQVTASSAVRPGSR